MFVEVIDESGYYAAITGIGLSYGLTSGKEFDDVMADKDLTNRLHNIAIKLAHKGNAENKFLRQISVVLDVEAPIYWWKQADTYKVGTTAQSESTMHTILHNPITQSNFEHPIFPDILTHLESLRQSKNFETLINELPCGWLQRRILTCNYAVLQNIYNQRHNHKIREWHIFCDAILNDLKHPEFIRKEAKDEQEDE